MRSFTLRRQRPLLRAVSTAGSTLLTYIFKTIPKSPPDPFGFVLRPRGVLPSGDVPHTKPVARSDSETPRLSSDLHSPPGPLDPSGSSRATRNQPKRLALASCPIFLPSPLRPKQFLITSATDHRSGFATSRQARCPSNLLEPHSSCTTRDFQVKQKLKLSSKKYLTAAQ